jgi:hypothetical protein
LPCKKEGKVVCFFIRGQREQKKNSFSSYNLTCPFLFFVQANFTSHKAKIVLFYRWHKSSQGTTLKGKKK